MSHWIRQYLLSVTAAAIICTIIKGLVGQKTGNLKVVNLIAGIFLTITVVAPWARLEIDDIGSFIQDFSVDAESAAAAGSQYRLEEMSRIIKSQAEAYILDKAASMGAELQADVTISENDPIIPYAVTVHTTSISPYAREQLKRCIANDLAIPEARQIWT